METKIRRFLTLFILPVLVWLAAGCSESSSTTGPEVVAPTSGDYADAVEDFSATLADPSEGMLPFWMSTGGGGSFAPAEPVKGGAPEVCDTTIQRGGFTITIDYTFFDAEDNPSENYNPLNSVRMTREMTIAGSLETPRRTATVNHQGLTDVSGITPADSIRTLTAVGTRSVESSFQARWRLLRREFEAEHEWSTTPIRFYADRNVNPYPLEGVITVDTRISASSEHPNRTVTIEVNVHYTVTFDGSRYALVEVQDGPTYWIDLEEGRALAEQPG